MPFSFVTNITKSKNRQASDKEPAQGFSLWMPILEEIRGKFSYNFMGNMPFQCLAKSRNRYKY